MIIRTLAVFLAVACTLWGCAAPEPAPAPEAGPSVLEIESVPPEAEEHVIAPTPEMLEAALFGDPDAMAAAVPLSGCPLPSTCPAQYASCGSWSSYTACDFACESDPWCSCGPDIPDQPPCEPNPFDTLARTTYKSFRVCFKPGGGSCTEWRWTISNYCGC